MAGNVREITEQLVILEGGIKLPADLVVYSTGYGSMNGWAADLTFQLVADKVGKVWSLGSETAKEPGPWKSEQRYMWNPTSQEHLWLYGDKTAPVGGATRTRELVALLVHSACELYEICA